MLIDNALTKFALTYSESAINSILDISKELGLKHHGMKIKLFNIQESFNSFIEFLSGYSKYKIENKTNEEATPQEVIMEHTNNFISTLFKEEEVPYDKIPSFVESYLENVNTILELIDNVKKEMFEFDIDGSEIGAINEMVDNFMIKLHESFDPSMNRILWATGYNSKQKLKKPSTLISKPIFL